MIAKLTVKPITKIKMKSKDVEKDVYQIKLFYHVDICCAQVVLLKLITAMTGVVLYVVQNSKVNQRSLTSYMMRIFQTMIANSLYGTKAYTFI